MTKLNVPVDKGFYWARGRSYKWWNLIVRVYGDFPFYKLDIWDYSDRKLLTNVWLGEVEEFGPKIDEEAPDIERDV
jgi:hypothetical protein